jgi:hypothetical protein
MAEEETITLYRRKDGNYGPKTFRSKGTTNDAESVYSLEQLQTLSLKQGDLVYSGESVDAPASVTVRKSILTKPIKN